ncbi:hypothetical protein HDU98_006707 [Podochytrium sp. JEL0797]|nr:hypothetical protein HDU98_006707 [Podochytrium sp. JEL0797]
MDANADRDEKLRLARKRLDKFQKGKKKEAAAAAGPLPTASFKVPAAVPLMMESEAGSPSVYAQPEPYEAPPAPGSPEKPQTQQKRSMFDSFVSAVATTAAAIITPPDHDANSESPQLKDARKKLLQAKDDERRARSRSPSPTRVSPVPPPQSHPPPPPPARSHSSSLNRPASPVKGVTNVLGMASRLFSGTSAASLSTQPPPPPPQNDYQYGVQEPGNTADAYYQNNHHGEYQYGQQEEYDQNAYAYGAQEGHYVDPGYLHQQQQGYSTEGFDQQYYEHQQYDEQQQYNQPQYSQTPDAYGNYAYDPSQQQYYYDQNEQAQQHPDSAHYYDQNAYSMQPEPSIDANASASHVPPTQRPITPNHDPNPFSMPQDQYANSLPWDPTPSGQISNDPVPGFGTPVPPASAPSPFDSIGNNAIRKSPNFAASVGHEMRNKTAGQEPFTPTSLSGSEQQANIFRQETIHPLAAKSPSPSRQRSPSPTRSRKSSSSPTRVSPANQQRAAASPIPFSIQPTAAAGHQEFPIGEGLQTWPTSPTKIQTASLSRRPSNSHSRHNSAYFDHPVASLHTSSPILEHRSPSPAMIRSGAPSPPTIDNGHYQQEEDYQYHHPQPQDEPYQHEQPEYDLEPSTAPAAAPATTSPTRSPHQPSGTIQIPTETYTTLVSENDALLQQYAATETHLTSAVSARMRLEQRCAELESERERFLRDVDELGRVVQGFGDLERRTREVEAGEAMLVDREREVEMRWKEVDMWEGDVERREREIGEKEGEMVTTGSDELDSRMRVRILEIEQSRGALEGEREQVKRELEEARQLKGDSADALKRLEASNLKVREREEESKRVEAKLSAERAELKSLEAAVEAKAVEVDSRDFSLRQQEDDFVARRQALDQEYASMEKDKSILMNSLRNCELEEARLSELRHSLDVLADRLREDQESVRHREAEIRSREDEFLSQASNMANEEAMQLAEYRKNYDEDMARLQADSADLQRREEQLATDSNDMYRLSQEVNDEKAHVEQMKREIEQERVELAKQAAEAQEAQASIASQQAALDDAVASFSEMKEYIDNSMKENEARIHTEFDSLQQGHAELKEREEASMREIQNERLALEQMHQSIENERQQQSLHYGASSAMSEDFASKINVLEQENDELRRYIDELSHAKNQEADQIAELQESNRQLQSNVLRLTQMIDSGVVKKTGSFMSVTPDGKPAVDERVEMLEKKYEEISKEEGALKEAAATLISTANDLKKIWSDAAPALEELKMRRGEDTPESSAGRNHLWTHRREGEGGSSVRSLSEIDVFGNKASQDLFNVIVSLTSTNQNLTKKLDETMTQVQTLQEQKIAKSSPRHKTVSHSSRRDSLDASDVASSNSVAGFNSAKASSLNDNFSASAETASSRQDGNSYYNSNETVSSYGASGRDANRHASSPFSRKPAAVYPSARSMTKVPPNPTVRHTFGSVEYTDSVSEYSEGLSETMRAPPRAPVGGTSLTPTSLPMARVSSHRNADSDSSDSIQTPRGAAGPFKRSTVPANYYSSARKSGGSSSGYGARPATTSFERPTEMSHHYTEPESNSQGGLSHHVSLEGLRSYFTEKDLEAFSEPTQRVMFGSRSVASKSASAVVSKIDTSYGAGAKYGRSEVKVGSAKAKSDTEGLNGWGASRATIGGSATGLRALSSTGNRTESIREAIRARIKERDLGQI